MGKHYKLWLTDSVTTTGSVYPPDSIFDILLLFALDICPLEQASGGKMS